ncbi:hypothetical protein NIT7645_00140 [Phaeobacter italicus]|nr:hypothetical protein NIT7645_00140 [Phaeobacter italicus]SFH39859.1 hypothetical protein SAMN04488019_11278 [Phaeobacter italicus]
MFCAIVCVVPEARGGGPDHGIISVPPQADAGRRRRWNSCHWGDLNGAGRDAAEVGREKTIHPTDQIARSTECRVKCSPCFQFTHLLWECSSANIRQLE